MFLSAAELTELTGYKRHAEQCAWLRANGIRYALDRWRRPRVLRSEIERALSSESGGGTEGPRLDWMRRAG
jgi:hypothetical protein